jgi:hypothetical protein
MKPETESRHHHNGTHTHIPSTEEKNGHSAGSMSMHVDGIDSDTTPSGFSRLELVRLMVQSLQSLGYQ